MIVKVKEILGGKISNLYVEIECIVLLCNDSDGNAYLTTTFDHIRHYLTAESFEALTEYLCYLDVETWYRQKNIQIPDNESRENQLKMILQATQLMRAILTEVSPVAIDSGGKS